uniref:Uncharacterized protein n=1 Tax=Octopus bimaculoides TaxID=37653 RepID=A0A0L8IAZ9_OCTBM
MIGKENEPKFGQNCIQGHWIASTKIKHLFSSSFTSSVVHTMLAYKIHSCLLLVILGSPIHPEFDTCHKLKREEEGIKENMHTCIYTHTHKQKYIHTHTDIYTHIHT